MFESMAQKHARVWRKTDDNAILEVRPDGDGDSLLLNLPGLGVKPFPINLGDHVLVTFVGSRVRDVQQL